MKPAFTFGKAKLYEADCLDWFESCPEESIHAVVTDPPYGLVEYSPEQQTKLRAGKGGVWRIPPSFGGSQRAPVPRFTVLSTAEAESLESFFLRWGKRLWPALVPGAHVLVAGNPLLTPYVAKSMMDAGFERRGDIIRLVQTLRGGDRPKNFESEFPEVSVMPRSRYEPWGIYRKPLEGRVADNLRRWGTGAFRRISTDVPFSDLIVSSRTPREERQIAPHPSLKPQKFLREICRAVLPTGEGILCDPFAGSGSTLAAAHVLGVESVGIEIDPHFVAVAKTAIPKLATLTV